jgi:uncharacterized protein (DUF2236 family)
VGLSASRDLDESRGLFGPGSVSWRIDREVFVLAGGSCALLMQAAHPAVAAGVADHSTYRTDPFGRLLRTLTSSFAVVFGTTSQAHAAIHRVNAIHRAVRGVVPETGRPYSALDPEALLWVHSTLVDTALRVYGRFVTPLSHAEAEAYHAECRPVAELLGVPVEIMPASLAEMRAGMERMIATGEIQVTPTARRIAHAVLYPSRFPPRFVWEAAHLISISTLPPSLRRQYGLGWNAARERGVERLATVSRAVLPVIPSLLRHVPHARSAERRVNVAMAAQAADSLLTEPIAAGGGYDGARPLAPFGS